MTPPRSDGQSGTALLRRLQILRILYGVVVGLMVVGGDFVYPRLDRRIGRIDTDIIESVVLSLLTCYFLASCSAMYLSSAPPSLPGSTMTPLTT